MAADITAHRIIAALTTCPGGLPAQPARVDTGAPSHRVHPGHRRPTSDETQHPETRVGTDPVDEALNA